MSDEQIAINVYQLFVLSWLAAAVLGPLWGPKPPRPRPKHLVLIFRIAQGISVFFFAAGIALYLFRDSIQNAATAIGWCGICSYAILEGFLKSFHPTKACESDTERQ